MTSARSLSPLPLSVSTSYPDPSRGDPDGPGRDEHPDGDGPDLLCLSGRGDKDLAEVIERTGGADLAAPVDG